VPDGRKKEEKGGGRGRISSVALIDEDLDRVIEEKKKEEKKKVVALSDIDERKEGKKGRESKYCFLYPG